MKYKLTKKQIIEAVTTEPLSYGMFFEDLDTAPKTCSVCAVGAVLRKAGKNRRLLSNISGFFVTQNVFGHDQLKLAEESKNFLSILSTHHEAFARNYNSKSNTKLADVDLQRLHLLNVIEAFCPPVVEFEV